jgi:hypothetical protein
MKKVWQFPPVQDDKYLLKNLTELKNRIYGKETSFGFERFQLHGPFQEHNHNVIHKYEEGKAPVFRRHTKMPIY